METLKKKNSQFINIFKTKHDIENPQRKILDISHIYVFPILYIYFIHYQRSPELAK